MTPPDSGFAQLSHRAQVLRLRWLARAALEHYDLEVRRLALLRHSYNTIFRVWAADGQRYVLRVNLPGVRRLEQIRAEMAWLAALRRNTGLQVPRPMPNRSGELVTTAHAPGVPEPRHCALFGWLSGSRPKTSSSSGRSPPSPARPLLRAAGWPCSTSTTARWASPCRTSGSRCTT
ncbi:MAG: hypothetical protein C4333_00045 [Meiothermus sp.]